MTAIGVSSTPALAEGSTVRLVHEGHSQHGKIGKLVGILPNPSKLDRNQWYDVRFDSGVYGRFLKRYLAKIPEDGATIERIPAA